VTTKIEAADAGRPCAARLNARKPRENGGVGRTCAEERREESMTGEQITLVRDSFQKVLPIADAAATLFYARLFDLDPALEPLFKGDIAEQGRKLMQMLSVAVRGLDALDQLLPALGALGARHVAYGVRDEHYETVGRALIWTLRKGLCDDFTPAVEAAWAETYAALAGAMKAGAAAVPRPEAAYVAL
jgi:hemoglobin-like flavoprotein